MSKNEYYDDLDFETRSYLTRLNEDIQKYFTIKKQILDLGLLGRIFMRKKYLQLRKELNEINL